MKYKYNYFSYVFTTAILAALVLAFIVPAEAQMMQQGKELRTNAGMHGMGFMRNGNSAYGEYVTLQVDEKNGNILNYGIDGNLIFNSISVKDFDFSRYYAMGTVTRIENKDGSALLQVHDNPMGVIKILTSKPMSITFDLAEGVKASDMEGSIELDKDNAAVFIIATSGIKLTINNNIVTADVPSSGAVFIRAAPVNMPMSDNLPKTMSREIAMRRVGAEIAIGDGGKYNVVNYTELQVRVDRMDPDRIELRLNSTNNAGQVVAINLDNTSLQLREQDRLRIKYDDQLMTCVNNPDDVFTATTKPACWLSRTGREKAMSLLYTGNFSEHVVDIEVENVSAMGTSTAESTSTSRKTPAFEITTGAIVLMIMAALIRRSKGIP